MRDERARRGPPGDGLQRRRLDFKVASLVEVPADRADDAYAFETPVKQLRVVDQVEISVPEAKFDILHPRPFVGMGQQRFAKEMKGVGEDRQLASARCSECPVNSDQVSEVEVGRQ